MCCGRDPAAPGNAESGSRGCGESGGAPLGDSLRLWWRGGRLISCWRIIFFLIIAFFLFVCFILCGFLVLHGSGVGGRCPAQEVTVCHGR